MAMEVFPDAVLNTLIEKMASMELLKSLFRDGIAAQFERLYIELLMIRAVLTDAEIRQISNRSVKDWLYNLEDLVYDLDDLVDELNTEAYQRKLRDIEDRTSNIRKFISSCCPKLSLNDLMFDRGIASRLKEISVRLEHLAKLRPMLSLQENARLMHPKTGGKATTTSLVDESDVYGREEDKEKLLELLLGAKSSDDIPISVISIVGMGGMGKTTLAQLVYNDVRLQDKFDFRAWACVSDAYDLSSITKTILGQVSFGRCDYDDVNILQVKLKQNLSNKKFLVVLDDVWNEDYINWDILRRPFLAGKPGSKILVTTRSERVANIMSQTQVYHLELLSDIDSLSLLARQAVGANNFDVRPDLRDIGKSVVRRCGNLPLAVKLVGRILKQKTSLEEWEGVLRSDIWMQEDRWMILPALKLSFQYLPPSLKQCFAYCAIFPRDYVFDKSELVYLWMAEGFLQQSRKESMEELGSAYFDELFAKSFFQKSDSYTSRFVMHDLIHDLAMSVAGGKCFMMDDDGKERIQSTNSQKVRHLSFIPRHFESYDRFSSLSSFKRLRTFLPISNYIPNSGFFLSQRVLHHILPDLNYIRELSLRGYDIYELPSSIGGLRHLRYFNLSRTLLKWLPESVSRLCNLQVLILEDCSRLAKLPARIESLVKLHHLNIANTHQLHEIPEGISRLTSLQTLSKMIVSKGRGLKIKDLSHLSLLQGKISIEELQNVDNVLEAMDAGLMHRPSLNDIRLVWSSKIDYSRNEMVEARVLNALKPHQNLSSLEIIFYGGAVFPSWIGDLSFSKLTKISFEFCERCTTLPTLGQLPLLKDLNVRGMDKVKVIGTEFYGESPFPSLEILTFEDMLEWEEWLAPKAERAIEIPKLRRLHVRRCPKLVRLPGLSFSSLCELCVENCNEVALNHMHNLTSLTQLKLVKLYRLTSVLNAFEQFPLKLEKFEIDDCEDLETLWPSNNIGQSLANLQVVVVKRCPKIFSIQEIGVHSSIRSLRIEDCESLKLLPSNISSYRNLMIRNCSSLKIITTLENCSTSLEDLTIGSWVNLSLTNLLGSVHNYVSLTELRISYCDGLESFPDDGLPTPNLRCLFIENCHELKCLPHWMELLLSLEMLSVIDCPSVETITRVNIPPNLTHLEVKNCERLNPLREWGLYNITSLCAFTVEGGYIDLVSFTKNDDDNDQHHLLPPSIKELTLGNIPNLKTLSKGLQNLNSLRHLSISKCPKLVALPMEDHLDRLLSLHIRDCPLLKKRCSRNKGRYWPIIANIPDIQIDGCSIYDPDSCP